MLYASKNKKFGTRKSPSSHSSRYKVQKHHAGKSGAPEAIAECGGTRLDPKSDTGQVKRQCWLCGKGRNLIAADVQAKFPGGPRCKKHTVFVHLSCWMDMGD